MKRKLKFNSRKERKKRARMNRKALASTKSKDGQYPI